MIKKAKLPIEKTQDSSVIMAEFLGERVLCSETQESRQLYDASRFGELKEGKIQYSLVEGLYLLEKQKVEVYQSKKKISFDDYFKKARKYEPNFWIRYCVFRDLRTRGYIVKTALKFGADFRVYDRGVKPGDDHAKWIVYPVHEGEVMSWYEFSAKNRVAHSTKKNLLVACVDDENDVTYWQISWIRP